MNFAERTIRFYEELDYTGPLPKGVQIMNPFRESTQIADITRAFYKKYYSDNNPRVLILGINPGRLGAGATGIPFTDTKRLTEKCGIPVEGLQTHEPSSVFVYDVIDAFGGAEAFYQNIYINSVCPLGFTATNDRGKEVNYNYYDSKELTAMVYSFIIENIRQQIALGVRTDICICFGTGKNEAFLQQVNQEYQFFDKIIALEHPRFVMQYKSRFKDDYIRKYLDTLLPLCQ